MGVPELKEFMRHPETFKDYVDVTARDGLLLNTAPQQTQGDMDEDLMINGEIEFAGAMMDLLASSAPTS